METNTSALEKFEEFYAKLSPKEKEHPEIQAMAQKVREGKEQAKRDAAQAELLEAVNKTFGTGAKTFKDFAVEYLKMVTPKKKRRAKALSSEQIVKIEQMYAKGKTPAEVASATGIDYGRVFRLSPAEKAKRKK